MPKIAVIIPVYNNSFSIATTLSSALQQTFTDFEVIIINDGSTDQSLKRIEQFTDDRISIYTQENEGVSAARNLAIEKATAPYIAFLDADDLWFPNHLEELHRLVQDFPGCGMYCSRYKIKTTEKHFQETSFRGINTNFRGVVANYFFSSKPFRISFTSALLIPKKVLSEFNGFNENCSNGEDVELWSQIGLQFPVVVSNKVTAVYNFSNPNSLSKQKIDPKKIMCFELFENQEKHNSALKEFMDLHRFFYAIQLKAAGKVKDAEVLFNKIAPKNITFTNRFLFSLPSFALKVLYAIKRKSKKLGIEFSTYN